MPNRTRRPRQPRRKPARRFPPEVLGDAEVRAVIDAARGPAESVARTRALLVLLYRSGLRLNEALSLRPKDVDRNSIRVLFAKGGRSRTVGIDPGAAPYLDAWLEARARRNPPPDAPLFCTRSGGKLQAASIRRLLPELGRRAGVAKRVHAHGFRHTHAAQLREEGVDIGVISKQLGHTSLLTTIRYLDHVAPTRVIETVAKRVWS